MVVKYYCWRYALYKINFWTILKKLLQKKRFSSFSTFWNFCPCATEGEKSKLVSLVSAGPANWGGWLPTLERGETVLCFLRNTTLAILFHGDDCSILAWSLWSRLSVLVKGHHSILNDNDGVQQQCTNSPPTSSARKCGRMVCRHPGSHLLSLAKLFWEASERQPVANSLSSSSFNLSPWLFNPTPRSQDPKGFYEMD